MPSACVGSRLSAAKKIREKYRGWTKDATKRTARLKRADANREKGK